MIIFGLNIILALSSNLYDTDFCRPTDLYDLLAEQAMNPVRIETRLAKN